MDNQLALNLAWLGGLWDADGCYCTPVQNRKGNTFRAYPEAKLASTNETIISNVVGILTDLGIHYNMEVYKAKRSHKELTVIRVRRLAELLRFLGIIEPYARGKLAQVVLLKCFIASRLERTDRKYNAKWDAAEKSFLERLHVLNAPGRREKWMGVNDCTVSAVDQPTA